MRRFLLCSMAVLASVPAWAAPAATIEVLPRFPTTRDAIVLTVTGDPEICWPVSFSFQPVSYVGQRIVLAAQGLVPPNPLPCLDFPGPIQFTLPRLPASIRSAEFRLNGVLLGAQAFEVREPATDLDLHGRRFEVRATWRDQATGVEHAAEAVQLTEQSGYFWFFGPGNVELTVKILDGRTVNGSHWVFLASLTDVAYAVTIVDKSVVCILPGCNERTYEGFPGQNRNFIDVTAFPVR